MWFSDVIPALAIVGFSEIACHVLEVRWLLAVPLKIIGAMMYVVIIVLGSLDPAALFNLVLLTGILWLSLLAKRKLEIKERQAHCDLVNERQKRCEAEFRLSQVQSDSRKDPRKDPRKDSRNDPQHSEADTESIFGQFFETGNGREDLEGLIANLAALGKQEHWLVQGSELKLLPEQVLGRGGFGVVVKGVFHGCSVAVKLASDPAAMRSRLPELCNELRILRRLRHQNIVGLFGCVLEGSRIGLVCELVEGQTLDNYVLDEGETMDVWNKFLALHGICSALQYLHTRPPPVVHGDVKDKNIMVEIYNDHARCKLLDFGLSRVLSSRVRPLGGTLCWMAPEVYRDRGQKPECSADVYSFGRLVYFVLTGRKPLGEYTEPQIKHMLLTATMPSTLWPGSNSLEHLGKALVDDCLTLDPTFRPSMADICEVLMRMVAENEELGFMHELVAPGQLLSWNDEALDACLSAPGHRRRGKEAVPASTPRRAPSIARPTKIRHALQSMAPTPQDSITRSLLTTMMQWNCEITSETCCLYHAAVAACMDACEALQAAPCKHDFLPVGSFQCSACGLILEENEACACSSANISAPDTTSKQPTQLVAL